MSASNEDMQEITASAAFQNPYDGHRSLTLSEQELLGEYARLSATTRRVRATRLRAQVAQLSTELSSSTLHNHVLSELRAIERKMGLVLTLFKASVWAIVMQQSDADEEAQELEYQSRYDIIQEEPEDEWESTDAPDNQGYGW